MKEITTFMGNLKIGYIYVAKRIIDVYNYSVWLEDNEIYGWIRPVRFTENFVECEIQKGLSNPNFVFIPKDSKAEILEEVEDKKESITDAIWPEKTLAEPVNSFEEAYEIVRKRYPNLKIDKNG